MKELAELTQAQPTAVDGMTKQIDHFGKLVLTCENDRGIGVHGENHTYIGQKRPLSVKSESLGTTKKVTSSEMQIVQESRAKRSRKSRNDGEVEGIKSAPVNISYAFRESTTAHKKAFRESTAYQKSHQKFPISEDRVWKLLEDMQVDNHLFTQAYIYLLENPDKIRALRGCPKHRQRNFLTEIMFNQVTSSR